MASARRESRPLGRINPDINTDEDESWYSMNNEEKRVARIFIHRNLGKKFELDPDVRSLKATFKRLSFDVNCCNDRSCSNIMQTVKEVAEKLEDPPGCLAVVVLTHGNRNGKLAAEDIDYDVDQLLDYFSPENCPRLAGKPKLFFLQACKGDNTAASENAAPSLPSMYPVASYADCLISYATFEDQCAFRAGNGGTWYIQTLCDQLDRNGTNTDLQTLLVRVNRIVNQRFRTNNPNNPNEHALVHHAPCFTSSLTQRLCFPNIINQQDNNEQ